MDAKFMLPMADLALLTLGSVLAAMTEMEKVTAIPLEVAQVGRGAAVVQHGEFERLSLTPEGLMFKGQPITADQVGTQLSGKDIVLATSPSMPTGTTLRTVCDLYRVGCPTTVEVDETLERNQRIE